MAISKWLSRGRELDAGRMLAKNHEFSTRIAHRFDQTAKLRVITQKNSLTCRAYERNVYTPRKYMSIRLLNLFVIFA